MEKALKEAKLHKQRVEQLEKENLALKKSVYDVCIAYLILQYMDSACDCNHVAFC